MTLNVDISVHDLFTAWAAFPQEGAAADWSKPNENQMVSMGNFLPRQDNYRKTYDIRDIAALAGSFDANEQLQSIQLLQGRPRDRVWGGHRRCLAALYRYLMAIRCGENPPIPRMRCELVTKSMSPVDEAIGALLLNEKVDPSPVEEALEYRRIMEEFHLDEDALAHKLGGEKGAEQKLEHIRRRLLLLNLITQQEGYPLLENVARGTISLSDGEIYAQLSKADQPHVARMRLSGQALAAQVRTVLSRPARVTAGVRETTPTVPLPSAPSPSSSAAPVQRPAFPPPPFNPAPMNPSSLGPIERRHEALVDSNGHGEPRFVPPPAPAKNVRTFNLGSGPSAIQVEVELGRFSTVLTLKRSGEPFNDAMVAAALSALAQFMKSSRSPAPAPLPSTEEHVGAS